MAISKTIEHKGLQVSACYIKVSSFAGDKERISFTIDMMNGSYTLESRGYECSYSLEGGNPITQAYNHLKTLEEFVGATDC